MTDTPKMPGLTPENEDTIINNKIAYTRDNLVKLHEYLTRKLIKDSTSKDVKQRNGAILTAIQHKINILSDSNADNIHPEQRQVILNYNLEKGFDEPMNKMFNDMNSSHKAQIAVDRLKNGKGPLAVVMQLIDSLLHLFGFGKRATAKKRDDRVRRIFNEFDAKIAATPPVNSANSKEPKTHDLEVQTDPEDPTGEIAPVPPPVVNSASPAIPAQGRPAAGQELEDEAIEGFDAPAAKDALAVQNPSRSAQELDDDPESELGEKALDVTATARARKSRNS